MTPFGGTHDHPPAALLKALRDPAFYAADGPVEVRETHASLVFLVGADAYKLKKPVDFGFLDYSTLARRRLMCRREVELNRRLAPGVYLGVVPVTKERKGFALGGRGAVIDCLVHMRRLNDGNSLSALVRRREATEAGVRRVARKIAAFHSGAGRGPAIDAFGRPSAIARNHEENFAQVRPFVGHAISGETFTEITEAARRYLKEQRPALLARIAGGHIRDGHGDLRAEHVYMENGVEIIDCIEFTRRFRYADTAADAGFLAMDLEAHGVPDLARAFVAEYTHASADDMGPVLGFYQCYRAFTRGKVACLRWVQPGQEQAARDSELAEARRFFHLALKYARGGGGPVLILMCGLTGTGKSTLAAALGEVLAAEVVTADEVRKRMAGVPAEAGRDEPLDTGLYAPAMNAQVYEALHAAAECTLRRGRNVILDATYRRRSDRAAAGTMARRLGAELFVIECTAPERAVRERIERRRNEGGGWSDGRWEVYLQQRAAFEPLEELRERERIAIDTTQPLAVQVAEALWALEHRLQAVSPSREGASRVQVPGKPVDGGL